MPWFPNNIGVLLNRQGKTAEAGRFSEAVQTAQRAVALASAHGETALVDACRAQMKLYQAGVPYREAATGAQPAPAPTR